MSLARLILGTLKYHWITNLAVALAVMAAGAVLTGALLVGDSMRGSLRHLLLDQLGQIDEVLVTDRFFREQLADEIIGQPAFQRFFGQAVPAVVVQGTIEKPQAGGAVAGGVGVIGCDERFWQLGTGQAPKPPGKGQIVLNAPLAAEVGRQVGDEVLLRIGSASQIPPDTRWDAKPRRSATGA